MAAILRRLRGPVGAAPYELDLARRSPHPAAIATGVVLLWAIVWAKTGTGLIFGIDDLIARSKALPDLLISGKATDDYINWSVLPLAVGKVFGAEARSSFALVQFVLLVPGSVGLLLWTARRRPAVAANAALGLFACMVPAWALYSMGTYDQLLIVLLLAATIADRSAAGAVLGVLIGVTHAEAGAVAVIGLLALSAIEVGPRIVVRWWTLAGILASRLVLLIWFRIEGQSGDRFTFIEEYGLSKLTGYFADTWPYIVWSAAAGGWVIIVGTLALRRSRRLTLVVAGILTLNLATTAITADQSRVIMLTTFPLVVALATFSPTADDPQTVRDKATALRLAGTVVGLIAPLWISWIGEIAKLGDPFAMNW